MKKSVLILLILVILIVIVIAGVLGYSLYEKYNCEKLKEEYDISLLKTFKCMSLCPEETTNYLNDVEITHKNYISSDCKLYCLETYHPERINKEAQKKLVKCTSNNMDWESAVNHRMWMDCSDEDSPTECLKRELAKNQGITDLSEVQLGDYPKYDLFIQNLTCSDNSADLTLSYLGDQENIKIVVLINGAKIDFSETIGSGQTKTFHLTNVKTGAQIDVSPIIQKEGKDYLLDVSDRAYCP